jgi:hypothetical protein
MRPHDDDPMSVETLLRHERPAPRPEFATELDARAASGFAKPRVRERKGGRSTRRLQFALGAVTVVVVTTVAVTATGVLEEEQPVSDPPTAIGVSGEADSQEREAAPVEPTSGGSSSDLRGSAVAQPLRRGDRQVARTANLSLSAAPEEIREVADGVIEVTHRYGGFVVSSSVSSGDGDSASGDFNLELPARNLQPALDDLSALAHVSSLTEATDDITKRFVTGRERIEELTVQRERLRSALAEAGTPEEERSIRLRLKEVRTALEGVRADLAEATERVRHVPVHVGIAANGEAVGTGWSVGDALDDAVRVLEFSLGAALIVLAAGVPIAIIAALAWLAARAWVRRRREEALDEQTG